MDRKRFLSRHLNAIPRISTILVVCLALGSPLVAADPKIPSGAKVFINPAQGGFDVFMMKALEKKKVPVVVTGKKEDADFEITAEDGTSTRDRLFSNKSDTVDEPTIKVVNTKTGEVVYTYSTRIYDAIRGKQSAAENLAKHLAEAVKP